MTSLLVFPQIFPSCVPCPLSIGGVAVNGRPPLLRESKEDAGLHPGAREGGRGACEGRGSRDPQGAEREEGGRRRPLCPQQGLRPPRWPGLREEPPSSLPAPTPPPAPRRVRAPEPGRALEAGSSDRLKGKQDVMTSVSFLKKVCSSDSRCCHLPGAEGRVGMGPGSVDTSVLRHPQALLPQPPLSVARPLAPSPAKYR